MGAIYTQPIQLTTTPSTNRALLKSFMAQCPDFTLKYEGSESSRDYVVYERRWSAEAKDVCYLYFVVTSSLLYGQVFPDIHPTLPYSPMAVQSNPQFSSTAGNYSLWATNYSQTRRFSYAFSTSATESFRLYSGAAGFQFRSGVAGLAVVRPVLTTANRTQFSYLIARGTSNTVPQFIDATPQWPASGSSQPLDWGTLDYVYQRAGVMAPPIPSGSCVQDVLTGQRFALNNLPVLSASGVIGHLGSEVIFGAASGLTPWADRMVQDGVTYILLDNESSLMPSLFWRL